MTSDGIKLDPEKVETIRNFPPPEHFKQLRGFLGLVNFYSKFNNKYAAGGVMVAQMV